MEKLREKMVNVFKTYEEPEFDKDTGKFINKSILKKLNMKTQGTSDEDQV